MLETITQPMVELEHGNTTQHRRDMKHIKSISTRIEFLHTDAKQHEK